MNIAEFETLARNFTGLKRETLEKYLPVIIAIAVAWLLARGLRKSFWTLFGLSWAFYGSGASRLFWH